MSIYSRLISCDTDKSIKIYQQNDSTDEISNPIDTEGWTRQCLKLKNI